MLNRVSIKLVGRLAQMGLIPFEQIEIAIYGCETLLYTIVSTTGLLLIGGLYNMLIEATIIVGIFYTNQSLGGGFHASTHVKCFLVMAFGLVVAMTVLSFNLADIVVIFTMLLACTILFSKPIKLHNNKMFLMGNAKQYIQKSKAAVCFEACVFILVSLIGLVKIRNAIALGAILSALSRTVAIVFQPSK